MKLSTSAFVLAVSSAFANANPAVYQPLRIAYDDLVNAHATFPSKDFRDALQHVGLVSVTGIPEDADKEEALSWLHSCALESEGTIEHKFDDDTVRLTLSTHTIPGPGGAQPIDHKGSASAACDSFSKMTDSLREVTGKATNAFANRLADVLNMKHDHSKGALLYTKDGSYSFDTIADVVENGEHLEHFHSYQKKSTSNMRNTIDMHVDQGLFIVFTPGAIVDNNKIARLSEGFYIELEDGSQAMVDFDASDDLVFMLGDGVNQIIKPRYGDSILRATPHALSLPTQNEEARVWYGRMVLPPSSAMHPEHGETFGEIRQEMIDASLSGNEQNGVGCTGNSMARQLETESCAEGTTMCWHRCMNNTEYGVSEEICAEQSLDLVCMNPRRQLWDQRHGDYFPGCLDNSTAVIATPFPSLPGLPRDEEVCNDFATFAADDSYSYSIDLNEAAKLLWSVDGDMINMKLAVDGLFGFMAIGFAGLDGWRNGMYAANIVMALPGDNYTAFAGLDLELPGTIQEYVIHSSQASFRHWQTPVSAGTATGRVGEASSVETNDCYSALYLTTSSINGIAFDPAGTDDIVWAANTQDYYAGYHGLNRGRWHITWSTGEALLIVPEEEVVEEETSAANMHFTVLSAVITAAVTAFVARN